MVDQARWNRAVLRRMPPMTPPLAYDLADRICALQASDEFTQQTMGMEPMEFRDCLAEKVAEVLDGRWKKPRASAASKNASARPASSAASPTPPPIDDQGNVASTITHSKALELLEAAPADVRSAYRIARKDGKEAHESLQEALAYMRRANEAFDVSQV
jgi:hypothetical protein